MEFRFNVWPTPVVERAVGESKRNSRGKMDRMSPLIRVIPHSCLMLNGLALIRALFDSEYAQDFGYWDPEQPYGYAPHDMHVIAYNDDAIVGHVGSARREIAVGEQPVVVAGVGGVLVSDSARCSPRGAAHERGGYFDAGRSRIDFGYLGRREEVAPFYQSCGWARVVAAERWIDRTGAPTTDLPGQRILIFPMDALTEWPSGEVDLRGRAW